MALNQQTATSQETLHNKKCVVSLHRVLRHAGLLPTLQKQAVQSTSEDGLAVSSPYPELQVCSVSPHAFGMDRGLSFFITLQ